MSTPEAGALIESVQAIEAKHGEDLVNETAFVDSFLGSYQQGISEIEHNPFLEDGGIFESPEKDQLKVALGQKYQSVLDVLVSDVAKVGETPDFEKVSQELDIIFGEAQAFLHQMQSDLFRGIDEASDRGGIYNSEFRKVFMDLDSSQFSVSGEATSSLSRTQSPTAESLDSVIRGEDPPKPLPGETWEKGEDLSPDEEMALDSAYNMGVRGAFDIKNQLLIKQLLSKAGQDPGEDLVLDGGLGPSSKRYMRSAIEHYGGEYTGNRETDVETLRAIYEEVFGEKPSLFLTQEEIDHPDYKFENKGVFRGRFVAKIIKVFQEGGLNIESLDKVEEVLGKSLTSDIRENFNGLITTMKSLNIPDSVQQRMAATAILESGLVDKELFGLVNLWDRSDAKWGLSVASDWAPKLTSLATKRLSVTSAGLTQVNYRTAQALLAEHTGVTYSRPQLIEALENNPNLSTILSALVYQQNQQQINQLRARY